MTSAVFLHRETPRSLSALFVRCARCGLCGTHPSHNTPSTTFLHNSSMNMRYNVGEVEKGKRFSTLGKTEEL